MAKGEPPRPPGGEPTQPSARGRRGRTGLSDEDRALWDKVARSVSPLKSRSALEHMSNLMGQWPADTSDERAQKQAPPQNPPDGAAETNKQARPQKAGQPGDRRRTTRPMPQATPPQDRTTLNLAPKHVQPIDRKTRNKLAKGRLPIEARIDLHGMTQDQAHRQLLRFLVDARRSGLRHVLIITGKGGRDGQPGILRLAVPSWLEQPSFRAHVSATEQAHIGHGGEGALYVKLRRL